MVGFCAARWEVLGSRIFRAGDKQCCLRNAKNLSIRRPLFLSSSAGMFGFPGHMDDSERKKKTARIKNKKIPIKRNKHKVANRGKIMMGKLSSLGECFPFPPPWIGHL